MHSGRVLIEVATHQAWLLYSRLLFATWRRTGIRPTFLSSKGQDRWITTEVFPGRRDGFFFEVGAGNGFTGSDTFVLEQDFGWRGICVEANPSLYSTLVHVVKRRSTSVNCCLDIAAGKVEFALSGDTSGIIADDTDNSFRVRGDWLMRLYASGSVRTMATCTVSDVLRECQAPGTINYLSLDVEGAEERIIRSFPFGDYRVEAMSVERPTEAIHNILRDAGLVLVAHRLHDGFYLQERLIPPGRHEIRPRFSRKQF